MKIRKLRENYLDDLHKYNKKRQKGLSPFSYLNPNAGDVPKAIGRFNNSVDTSANVGMMGEAFDDEEIIKDDPEVVEEIKQNLFNLGDKVIHDLDFKQENLPPEMRLKSLDIEVDYVEKFNDYYLILYIETYEPFTGDDFRRYFMPEIIDSIRSSMDNNTNFEFYVEINCYDVNSKSYATETLYVDIFKHVKEI